MGLAEITWRWSLGFAGLSLSILTLVAYFDTLPVTSADMFLLQTHQPTLVLRALEHILRGSTPRLVEAGLVLGLAFAVAWVVAASVGRGSYSQCCSPLFFGIIVFWTPRARRAGDYAHWLGSIPFVPQRLWLLPLAVWEQLFLAGRCLQTKIPRRAAHSWCLFWFSCW